MKKRDWIGFLLAFIIFAVIQIAMGTFDWQEFIVVSLIVIAIRNLYSLLISEDNKCQ